MDPADRLSGIERKIFLVFVNVALQNAFDAEFCRSIFLPDRIGLIRDRRKERRIDSVVGRLDDLRRSKVAFPKFPCEFFHGALPRDGADNKSAICIDIDRFEDVSSARNQISGEQKILVKAKPLRINEIDLIFCPAIDNEHRVRKRIRRVWMIRSGDRIEIFLRRDPGQRVFIRIRYRRHRARGFASRRRLSRHLRRRHGAEYEKQ